MPGTIGYTTIGANSAASDGTWFGEATVGAGRRYTATTGDVVTEFAFYGDSSGDVKVAIYEYSGGVPTNRVGAVNTLTVGASAGWYTLAVNIVLTNGVEYVVAYDAGAGPFFNIRYDSPGGSQQSFDTTTGLPATWGQDSTGGDLTSFYATVSAGNSGAPTLGAFTSSASGTVTNPPAAPTVRAYATATNGTDAAPAFTVTLPAGVATGDLLIAFAANDTTGTAWTASPGNGWVQLSDEVSGSACRLAVYALIADGSDTLSIAAANNNDYSCTVVAIQVGTHRVVNVATDIVIPAAATNSSGNADPPASGTVASDSWLAIAACAVDMTATGDSISAYPSNYGNGVLTKSASSTSSVGLGVGHRALAGATSENPGTFTNTSRAWIAKTLLVPSANYTGTVAVALDSFTSSASGTFTSGITGTVAATLASFNSSASGTATNPDITGTVAVTLGSFTSSASGTHTPPPISGTVAVTLAAFTPTAAGVAGFVIYPASISGRKILDQFGNVYLMRTFSSWKMALQLSNSDITTALEGVVDNGFNAVTVWAGGGETFPSGPPDYTNQASQNFWSGTPWASSLGAAWASVDWVVTECLRLGLVVNMSFCVGNDGRGCRADMEAATNTNMYDAGVAVANRYLVYPHIVWHFMIDDTGGPGSTMGARIEALFDGINDTEGATTRPFRWMEPALGSSINEQGWYNTTQFKCPVNGVYEYTDNSVEAIEAVYSESGVTTVPFGDVEPPYDGSTNYTGNMGQQLRERSWAIFLEGGSFINYGQENWWPFGSTEIFDEGIEWQDVPTHDHTIQQSYIWTVIEQYVAVSDWDRSTSFVTTGEGSGDTKAAIGASGDAALAYFPNNRTIQVDTTIIAGTGNVQLRWFDPVAGTYSTIASSEAQQTGRSVTMPAARGDGTRDFVLVVNAVNDRTGTVAITLDAFTSSASGTTTPPSFTGTVAATLDAFTSSASGTSTPPSFTGTAAVTLDSFTSSASGTSSVPSFTGTVAATLDVFTASATGTSTPPEFTGTVAVTLAAFTTSASGTSTPPAFTGTVAVTLDAFTSNGLGSFTPAGSGAGATTLEPFIATASGTRTVPSFTGTAAVTLDAFIPSASGTYTPPAFTGTAATTLNSFTGAATGTTTVPAITGTVAVTLDPFTAFGATLPTGAPSVSRTWHVRADDRTLAPIHDRRFRIGAT